MLKPTSHPKPTPINISQSPTLCYLEPFPTKRNACANGVMGVDVISGATTYPPPLPPYKIGDGIHSISGLFKVVSRGLFKPIKSRVISWYEGVYPGQQGDGSTTEPSGIMEVAMLGFDLAWV